MTIATSTSRVSFACDGATKVFPVPIQAYFNTDFTVILTAPASAGGGEATLTLNSDYTLATSGTLSPTAWTLTTLPANAYITGYTLQVIANPVQTQQTQYVQGQAFPSAAVQANIDRLTQMVQRVQDQVSRAIRAPDGDVNPSMLLPVTASRLLQSLMTDGSGNITLGVPSTQVITTALLAPFIGHSQTAAEVATVATPTNLAYDGLEIINVLRYGIIPNSAGAATANTTALTALLNPSNTGPTGRLIFPNTTGADTYYFNNMIQVRDGIRMDLCGCTLNFAKTYAAADNLKGWLMFIRDVSVENGSITVNYDGTAGAGQNPGPIMRIGSRQGYAFAGYTGGIFDQEDLVGMGLPPMGNITLRNLRLTTNNPNAACSFMVNLYGGLRNVLVENIVLTGNGASGPECGFYYEFGYATRNGFPAVSQRWSSSHATNMVFRNITGTNLNTTAPSDPYVVALVEAYNAVVENIHSDTCCGTFEFRIGEAHFYRPWTADATGVKRCITVRNITSQGATLTGCYLNGAQGTTAGYLSDANMIAAGLPVLTPTQKVDLMHFSLDGFALDGASAGVKCSGPIVMKNGTAIGGSNPIFLDGDCSVFSLENVEALNGSSVGMRISDPSTLFARNRRGSIRNCKVAGNTGAGISLANIGSVAIENCQLGYNVAFDAANETTQTDGVSVDGTGTNAGGVYCKGNFVTVSGAGVGYRLSSGTTTICCGIEQARGVITISGTWDIDGTAQTNAATIADKTSFINNFNGAAGVTNKYLGRRCYDTSNTRLMIAQGTGATSNWVRADGGATVTPA